MKYILTLIAFIFYLNANAQDNASFLFGKWKVVDATMVKNGEPKMKQIIDMLKPDLLKSLIIIEPNNKGKFNMQFDMDLGKPKISENVYWIYSAKDKVLNVYESKAKKSTIGKFYIHQEGKNTYFIMREYPGDKAAIMLKVIKQ